MTENERAMLAIVREHMGIDLDQYPTGLHTRMVDVGCDSLDIIEVAMAVEEEFAVSIPDDSLEQFGPDLPNGKTFADMLSLAERLSEPRSKS